MTAQPERRRLSGLPVWAEEDFQRLLMDLGHRGYGWLRPDRVRKKLEQMAGSRG
jgi:hypothetical protein